MDKQDIVAAAENLYKVLAPTRLEKNERLSKIYNAEIYLKREDQQIVRSYKIRGAYNAISTLTEVEKKKGIVCASAGNHAQGVALCCKLLGVKGVIYMPEVTPKQKVDRVRSLGENLIEIKLIGRTFDDTKNSAIEYTNANEMVFIHPFDDFKVIAGQGTVGLEIEKQLGDVDIVLVPVGGGGLLAGVCTYFEGLNVEVVGVDQDSAPKLIKAMENKSPIKLEKIDTFVDGCAVKEIGEKTFAIISKLCYNIFSVEIGRICEKMLDIYQSDGIILEPAGAVSLAGLDKIKDKIIGKKVVCVLSGGNNDVSRYPEIIERALVFKGLKHYFLVDFVQRPNELRNFLDKVLGKNDDIVRFEYLKKTNRESGSALVGLEFIDYNDYENLILNLDKFGINYKEITNDSILYSFII